VRLATGMEREVHPERNPVLNFARRLFPVTSQYEDGRFFVLREGRRWATPLFMVLLMVETTDLIFAVDSIPAVLAITRDPFIVFSSNIFAILGLRALYFSLAGVMGLFHYLHFGLALILVFVGLKMIASSWFHIPTPLALGVVVGVIAACVVASLLNPKPVEMPHPPGPEEMEREG
jgi:tellurite resistance protein TerC